MIPIYGRPKRWPRYLKVKIFKRDGHKCLICGSCDELTIDHIIPISKGGSNRDNNLMTLCKVCNQKKGDEIYYQFLRT